MDNWVVDKDAGVTGVVGSAIARDWWLGEASKEDVELVASMPVPSPSVALSSSVSVVSLAGTQWSAIFPPTWPTSPSPALDDAP